MTDAALLQAAQQGDREACGRLVEANRGLIWSVVRRYTRRDLDPEDLFQLGCLGFLKAVRGFDLAYGTQFSTYAVPKIAGEIRRFLRDDGPVKVSRGKKEQARTLRQARETLSARLGREPTLSQLARETGLSPEEIAATELAGAPVLSLQAPGETGLALEGLVSAPEEALVERVALGQAVAKLPPRDRQLLALRYDKGLTQSQTARILGVSQVQVSRLERKALERLRGELMD